jgi:hypothetical protein
MARLFLYNFSSVGPTHNLIGRNRRTHRRRRALSPDHAVEQYHAYGSRAFVNPSIFVGGTGGAAHARPGRELQRRDLAADRDGGGAA